MTDVRSFDASKEAQFGDYVQLLKPRVMSLVVFTAMVGLLVAPVAVNPVVGFISILFVALGAAGKSARITRELKDENDRAMSMDSFVFAAAA